MIETSKCAFCGAQLTIKSGEEAAVCPYCDSVNVIHKHESGTSHEHVTLTKFETKADYKLRYRIGGNDNMAIEARGVLLVSDTEICFKPTKTDSVLGGLENLNRKLNDMITGQSADYTTVRYLKIKDIESCRYKVEVASLGLTKKVFVKTRKGFELEFIMFSDARRLTDRINQMIQNYKDKGEVEEEVEEISYQQNMTMEDVPAQTDGKKEFTKGFSVSKSRQVLFFAIMIILYLLFHLIFPD